MDSVKQKSLLVFQFISQSKKQVRIMFHKLSTFRIQVKESTNVKVRQQQAVPRTSWHGGFWQQRQVRQGAMNQNNHSSQEYNLNEYVEATVQEVKAYNGQFKVHLRLSDDQSSELPIYIGNSEYQSLNKVVYQSMEGRSFMHDLFTTVLQELGYRVSHVLITELKDTTFYARVFVLKKGVQDTTEQSPLEFDARPSDAINLAYRFDATIFVNKSLIHQMQANYTNRIKYTNNYQHKQDMYSNCREELVSYHDPVFLLDLQRDIAVLEDRFEDAGKICKQRDDVFLKDKLFSSMCAMEIALQNGRVEEAAQIKHTIQQIKRQQLEQSTYSFQQDDCESSIDQQ
eukprot:TRINITY_DN18406_c0_g1_i1.p1 TRINITY_DN18406_c0_g1~~TRINITY_DN18406_c0_g1_i1.p1  ORF type:complete len:342 (-),score=29.72 TRINITY_DN18406_c0_g1_i1:1383-2408(-)